MLISDRLFRLGCLKRLGNNILRGLFCHSFYEGELKRFVAQVTGVEPGRQRLFFRGREKSDGEFLHASGVKDGAKLLLLEKPAPASVEPKSEPVIMDESMMKACEAVGRVRAEVDKLSAKVKGNVPPASMICEATVLFLVLIQFLCFLYYNSRYAIWRKMCLQGGSLRTKNS
jgi:hypothetical protein